MAGDGRFHTEFKALLRVLVHPGSVRPPFCGIFDDVRDEAPASFLEAMHPIEAWRADLGQDGDLNDVVRLEKLVEKKLHCWQEAQQQVKGDDGLPVDLLAALKLQCSGDTLCRLMFSSIFDVCRRPPCSNEDALVKGLLPFKPYVWLLQSGVQELPTYASDQPVYCELGGIVPAEGDEIVWPAPSIATPSMKAVLSSSSHKRRNICSINLTQLQARNISRYATFHLDMTETAVLLPPGLTFRCDSVTDMENDHKCYNLVELPSQHWILDLASSDDIKRSREQFESQFASMYTGSEQCSEWKFLRPELQQELIIVLTLLNAEHLCLLMGKQKSVGDLKRFAQAKVASRSSSSDQEILLVRNGQPLEDDRQRLVDIEPGLRGDGAVNEMQMIIRSRKQ